MKSKYWLTILIVFCNLLLSAQNGDNELHIFIADIIEQYASEASETIDVNTFYDHLMAYAQNPINLNKTDKNELSKLFFLADYQVENILEYQYLHGDLETIYELRLIPGIEKIDILRMLPFVTVTPKSKYKTINFKKLLKYSKNEFYLSNIMGLEQKSGYSKQLDSPYLGSPFSGNFRYRFNAKNRIMAGCTLAKDAGEMLWNRDHQGVDFVSIYSQLNDVGPFKKLIVGDFQAGFGQGLVLNTGFSLGKSSYVLNVSNRTTGITKYSSTSESNFFRGIASTVSVGPFDISVFYSNRNIDADTLNGSFQSIYKSGYHRTISEIDKIQTVNQQAFGMDFTCKLPYLQLGFTSVYTVLDHKLQPQSSLYNMHYFQGNSQLNAGVHYRAYWHKINMFGEIATTDQLNIATLNGFSFSPTSFISFIILNRYYGLSYDTFYANAFCQSSKVNDESGTYLGWEIHPFAKWTLKSYVDTYKFQWPKYDISSPSQGEDFLFQTDYSHDKSTSMYWRLRYVSKMKNQVSEDAALPTVMTQRRVSLRYCFQTMYANLNLKTVLEANAVRFENQLPTYGAIAYQDIGYKISKPALAFNLRVQIFDATDYNNRCYAYEQDILYAFSIPMFYGVGSRYYVNLKYDYSHHLSIWLKIAQTCFADGRTSSGSGYETISGNRDTDVKLMLKWVL
jgi:hypothetical protein